MSFAKDNGTDVYRLVYNKKESTYDVTDGLKLSLLIAPLETFEEAIDFMYKDSISKGNVLHKYVLLEN